MTDALELTAQIITAYAVKNSVEPNQLPELIRSVLDALNRAVQSAEGPKTKEPAVPVKKSVFDDHIVCLECGKGFKLLKRHLRTDHGLTPDQYRERFALPRDYSLISANYSEIRQRVAREIGLGRKGIVKRGGRKQALA